MDVIDFARYIGALALVLGLLGTALLAARKFGLAGIVAPAGRRRLAVVETLMIDARHKAVLLRDGTSEHLIVIGPSGTAGISTKTADAPKPSLLCAA